MNGAANAGMNETAARAIKRSERGEDAFARARRHSRLVRLLKFVLPGAALAIAALFFGYSLLFSSVGGGAFNLGSTSLEDGDLVMHNPSLDGFTSENLPYSLTAASARQPVGGEEEAIRLEGIEASLPIDEDTRATINAETGVFDRRKDRLALSDAITVTTTSGMVARLQSADIDIASNDLSTDDPVEIELEGMRVRADSFRATNGGEKLIFEKRVRVELQPAKIRRGTGQEGNGVDD